MMWILSIPVLGAGWSDAGCLLGLREDRAWLTRLGVIPTTRRTGVGQALCEGLLRTAEDLGIRFQMLEVIKNNAPAHGLFLKLGFYDVGELLVLRRSPVIPPPDPVVADAQRLDRAEALDLVGQHRGT
jgi:ribosomal protein S18 acetylase RimI-like enzyme